MSKSNGRSRVGGRGKQRKSPPKASQISVTTTLSAIRKSKTDRFSPGKVSPSRSSRASSNISKKVSRKTAARAAMKKGKVPGSLYGPVVKQKGPTDAGCAKYPFSVSLGTDGPANSRSKRHGAERTSHKPIAVKRKHAVPTAKHAAVSARRLAKKQRKKLEKEKQKNAGGSTQSNNATRQFVLRMPIVNANQPAPAWLQMPTPNAHRACNNRRIDGDAQATGYGESRQGSFISSPSSSTLTSAAVDVIVIDDSSDDNRNNQNHNHNHSSRNDTSTHASDHSRACAFLLPDQFLACDSRAMDRLNSELLQLAEYVKLSGHELKAREVVIGHTERFCKALWSINSQHSVECRIFGSYATPQVCTFQSDIDMAIYGVVPPDVDTAAVAAVAHEKTPTDSTNKQCTTTEQKASTTSPSNDSTQHLTTTPARVENPRQRKQQKLRKWMAALEHSGSSQSDNQQSPSKADSPDQDSDDSETSQSPLFIIDRTGDSPRTEDPEVITDPSDEDNDVVAIKQEDNSVTSRDTADQMTNFNNRCTTDESNPAFRTILARLPDAQGEIHQLSDDDDDDSAGYNLDLIDDKDDDDDDMQVSFVTHPAALATKTKGPVIGPTGETRDKVVRALNVLGRKLRKLPMTQKLHVRKHARVPIINLGCSLGFECDIAIGGHQGMDTSAYAASKTRQFQSFAPVVLALKMLLAQHDLDKPFTGGLGSFRLYVMVAYHLERYTAHGGRDRPAEAFMSFLFRYKTDCLSQDVPRDAVTRLSQLQAIRTRDGVSADMSSCFKIENCRLVFERCYQTLYGHIQSDAQHPSRTSDSVLKYIINSRKLQHERELRERQAKTLNRRMTECDYIFRNIIPQHI